MSTTAYEQLSTAVATGPLSGYTVLDLTRALAGPHAGMMMGDLGARVIKVETPEAGDDTRSWGPPFVGPEDNPQATYFLSCNRNKESIALDLKSEDGKDTLTRLIERSDVMMENFRTGVLERLGFGVERLHELNPRLVILSITGFGHDGPESHRSGYDQILQGEAGLMSLTGSGPDDPQRVGVPIADLLSGMYGAYGALAALLEREHTGRGQVVRTSLLASIVGVHAFQGTRATVAGQVPRAQGNHHPSIAPYGLFKCRDGKVQISVGSQKLWAAFAEAFGLDAVRPEYVSNAERVENHALLLSEIEEAFAGFDPENLLEKLNAAGIPAGKVRTLDEVYEWEQVKSQGLIVDVEHPVLGRISLPGPPLRFFDPATAAEMTRTVHSAPPLLDADGASIRSWLDAEAKVAS
ncbi:CaiB/BaiF CoA transferase family protein [Paeniglutamicibacter kerguelensis]|uniref:Crotonobetainyl-CoA:carnitine CoA-transferase CaiB-like acyl-CoA transferase n=1 Tax=Paeniglutamicibacter kerguelensis TaxID=254788 RepID=A0ABS4XFM1_9MICC|nr:CoA transferase [Paeniglutamicibacter kerguelensis]MBP2387255.1 crotonobetainyl-CoA:carnitine CoA-transferase CaiB-like acyl-CoA transferase [Paeniglutamicibacter kerguelensis]